MPERGRSEPKGEGSPPSSYPETSPFTNPDQHSFVLQGVTQLTADVGKLTAKVERLIEDVRTHGEKIDGFRHQVTFVKGALWVIGGVVGLLVLGLTWYSTGKLSITVLPSKG